MRRHRQLVRAAPAQEAFSEINTTPLIDVMLVLLIMFIITIPIAAHRVPLDLPQGPAGIARPVVHRLDLDAAGRISWDGVVLAEAELPARLEAMRAEPLSELHLRADDYTPYESFDRVLATVKRARVDRLGLIDNQRFAAGW